MPKNKSPRLDGLNVEFYLHYWNIVGHHLFKAIKYFFDTSSLPNSWGKTYIVLIPKINFPKLVSDFKPISLCNVSNKIISKIV